MNKVQRKISREVNKRIEKTIEKYYENVKTIKLESGAVLIETDPEILRKLLIDTTRHRVKRQVIKDFKEQNII